MAIIISYKWMTTGHVRMTRIATTLAETGREVLLIGLRGPKDKEEFVVGPHVRGVGFRGFNLRTFRVRLALRFLKALRRLIAVVGWTR